LGENAWGYLTPERKGHASCDGTALVLTGLAIEASHFGVGGRHAEVGGGSARCAKNVQTQNFRRGIDQMAGGQVTFRGRRLKKNETAMTLLCVMATLIRTSALPYRRKIVDPAYRAAAPSCCSMRISWLYFAVRSLRARLPVLI
jgi:hypothetical protein